MEKKISKLLSMLLAAVMVLSMAVTGFAAPEDEVQPMASSHETTGSITINNAKEGETYTIYQIFELTYADDKSSYSYKVVDSWKQFISGYTCDGTGEPYLFTLDEDGYLEVNSTIFDDSVATADVIAAFAKAALAYATENNIEPAGSVTAGTGDNEGSVNEDGTYTIKFDELNLGWYLIDSTQGTLCMLTSTDPDVQITEKNATPTTSKYVADSDYGEDTSEQNNKDDADNNDTLEYLLRINNVGNSSNLVIHDYLDPQLDTSTVEIKSITIYDGSTMRTLNENEYTYDATNTCGGSDCGMEGCSFEISFDDSLFDGLSDTAYMDIIFDVDLKESAGSFNDDDVDDIKNTANNTYGDNQGGTPSEADTYSYGFQIFKYTTADGENVPLSGATFILSKSETDDAGVVTSTKYAAFTEDSGVYLFDKWVETQNDATEIVSGSDGMIQIDGLHDGTYTLTETLAPDGYNVLRDPLTIEISVDADDYTKFTLTVDGQEVDGHQVGVLNNSGSTLPSTGGMGTTIFYIVGIILIIGAAVLFITKKRLDKDQ